MTNDAVTKEEKNEFVSKSESKDVSNYVSNRMFI